MTTCAHCRCLYHAEKSTAELRLTWCSMLCQGRDGCSIRDLLAAERTEDGSRQARVWKRIRAAIEREDAMLLKEAVG